MKNEALYNRTVDILVQAYFNDTLEHGDCSACAVGNICQSVSNKKVPVWYWKGLFCTDSVTGIQVFGTWDGYGWSKGKKEATLKMVSDTGYTIDELAKIEYAFETAPKGNSEDEWMFNGLMAVIDTLDQIHDNTDTAINSNSKQRFTKPIINA